MITLPGRGSTRRIASGWPPRLLAPARLVCIAASKRCCWWPRGIPSPRRPAAAASTAPVCTAGSSSTGPSMRPAHCATGRAADVPAVTRGSRRGGWRRPWRVIPAAAATRPRAGPCRCWRTTWPPRVSPSAPRRCGGGCTRRVIAGSGRATSMSRARRIWRRTRGDHPTSEEGLAPGRSAAVPRLDAVAAVSAPAGDLGAEGHAGPRADHRPQCQAGAVWGDRLAKRAPGGADLLPRWSGRCPGVPACAAPPLPRRGLALAADGSGERPHRAADPGAGDAVAHPLRVVAPAGARTERDGSALARPQAADRRQPTGRLHRRPRCRCRSLGADADTATSASQGRHAVQTFLAQKAVAELLATYLANGIRLQGQIRLFDNYTVQLARGSSSQ